MKVASVTEVHGGPERLSTNELVSLIDQIAVGRGSEVFSPKPRADDPYWPADFSTPRPALDQIRAQIAYEQETVDEKLRAKDQVFVITASGTRRVHLPGCHHVRHTVDREESWQTVLDNYPTLRPADLGTVYRLPMILTRSEVELLNSYIACQACAPTLDHQRKKYVLNARPMSVLSIAVHHIGRAVATPEGEDLGFLVGHQRIVTADGIRSIMTTTDRVVETDGEEKYLIAPRAEL
jgi:hypothetical protein